MMREGGKAKLTCPPGLAYGERAQGRPEEVAKIIKTMMAE